MPWFLDLAPGEALPPCSCHLNPTLRPTPAVGRVALSGRMTTAVLLHSLMAPDGFVELIGSPGSVRPHANHRFSHGDAIQ